MSMVVAMMMIVVMVRVVVVVVAVVTMIVSMSMFMVIVIVVVVSMKVMLMMVVSMMVVSVMVVSMMRFVKMFLISMRSIGFHWNSRSRCVMIMMLIGFWMHLMKFKCQWIAYQTVFKSHTCWACSTVVVVGAKERVIDVAVEWIGALLWIANPLRGRAGLLIWRPSTVCCWFNKGDWGLLFVNCLVWCIAQDERRGSKKKKVEEKGGKAIFIAAYPGVQFRHQYTIIKHQRFKHKCDTNWLEYNASIQELRRNVSAETDTTVHTKAYRSETSLSKYVRIKSMTMSVKGNLQHTPSTRDTNSCLLCIKDISQMHTYNEARPVLYLFFSFQWYNSVLMNQ